MQFRLAATRSISFRDSTDLNSHFPFQCNFHWPRLDSIINLISQSMISRLSRSKSAHHLKNDLNYAGNNAGIWRGAQSAF